MIKKLLMRLPIIQDMLADVWEEAAYETTEFMANQSSRSGTPYDPPRNPYERNPMIYRDNDPHTLRQMRYRLMDRVRDLLRALRDR